MRLGRTSEPALDRGGHTPLGVEVVDQNDFATRFHHPDAFIQDALRMRDQRDDELRHDTVE